MRNVFLSYADSDVRCARNLAKILKKRGLRVWMDDVDVPSAGNWGYEVGDALRKSDAMVVLLSPNAVNSRSVMHDIEYAIMEERFEHRLIPVVLKRTRDIPGVLEYQEPILATGERRRSAFQEVARRLLKKAG